MPGHSGLQSTNTGFTNCTLQLERLQSTPEVPKDLRPWFRDISFCSLVCIPANLCASICVAGFIPPRAATQIEAHKLAGMQTTEQLQFL